MKTHYRYLMCAMFALPVFVAETYATQVKNDTLSWTDIPPVINPGSPIPHKSPANVQPPVIVQMSNTLLVKECLTDAAYSINDINGVSLQSGNIPPCQNGNEYPISIAGLLSGYYTLLIDFSSVLYQAMFEIQ